MSEPLAATLLSRCGAGDASGRRIRPSVDRGPGSASGACCSGRWRWSAPGVPRRLACCSPLVVACSARRRARLARAALAPAPRSLLAGVALVVAPWTVRNAVALDRFVPISTGGGQVLFAGTYLPSDGDPEAGRACSRSLDRASASSSRPRAGDDPDACVLEQILARARRAALPGPGNRRGARADGPRNGSGTTSPSEPVEFAGLRRDARSCETWSRRAARRDASGPAGSAALALVGFGAARPGRARLAARAGGAGCSALSCSAITAIGALLVASPRRVLVAAPAVAAPRRASGIADWRRSG